MSAATLTKRTHNSDSLPTRYGSEDPAPSLASESNEIIPTLVIGDIHGHLDRLEALLKQEGLHDYCEACGGEGVIESSFVDADQGVIHNFVDCVDCEGDGWTRTNKPAEVVLLGDIGHFGKDGSSTGDLMTWRAAVLWADVILWGNHDRALVDPAHTFGGYMRPGPEVLHWIGRARWEGKLKLAHSSHGYLFTHAGLHGAFRDQKIPEFIKKDPKEFAAWVNAFENPDDFSAQDLPDRDVLGVVNSIGYKRGGRQQCGGILWRDIEEKLYDGFPQVFGHSADHEKHSVRYCERTWHTREPYHFAEHSLNKASYCVDVGGKGANPGDNCLAGVWLPEGRVVRIDLPDTKTLSF